MGTGFFCSLARLRYTGHSAQVVKRCCSEFIKATIERDRVRCCVFLTDFMVLLSRLLKELLFSLCLQHTLSNSNSYSNSYSNFYFHSQSHLQALGINSHSLISFSRPSHWLSPALSLFTLALAIAFPFFARLHQRLFSLYLLHTLSHYHSHSQLHYTDCC